MNPLQGPKSFFYDDSIDEETEDIDAEIPYVDPAEGASQIVKSNDLADPDLLETEQLPWRIVEEQTMEMVTISKIDLFYINLQFKLAISPCII